DRLRQAGFPPELVRAILSAMIDQRVGAPLRAYQAARQAMPFWQVHDDGVSNAKFYELSDSVRREKQRLLRDLFPNEYSADDLALKRRRYGNLSVDQIDRLEKVESDYADMESDISHG